MVDLLDVSIITKENLAPILLYGDRSQSCQITMFRSQGMCIAPVR